MKKLKKDRLYEVMEALKLSDYRVYTDVPEITKNMMVKLRNGETKDASSKILEPFCKYYKQVNPSYILIGEGSMFLTGDITQSGSSSSNNSGIITTNNYAGCGEEGAKTAHDISDLGERVAALEGAPVEDYAKAPISVPFYGELPVSAGQKDLATVLGNMKPTGWLNIPGMPKSIGAFPVIGCSMEPDIRQGDFVCIAEIDRWESVDPDKIYMIITHDDRMIKRLALDNEDKEILWCISPNYPKFKVYKSEILAIYRITFYGRCT